MLVAMRQFFFALIFLSTLPGYSQQTLGFSLPDGVNRIDIPIEIHNNLIVVPVILNNRLPLKFIIDTGVRTAILTQKVYSDILNLSYTRKYSLSGPGGQKLVDAFITSNVTFDMPGVHGQGHSMLVLQEDYLELKNSMGTDVHGILGYELFSRFVVMIDYEAKKMILMRPENFKPKKSYQALPIRIEDTKPFVELTISVRDSSQMTAKFLVDTGASHGLLIEEDSDKRLRMPDKNISSILGRGIAGIITGKISRTKLLKFGKYELNDLITSFPDDYAYRDSVGSKNFTPRNGSVGGDLLSRFTVIFNFPGEMMYIKKNASFKKKFYYSLSGITLRAKGPKLREYEISDVRTNTTAATAGLKVGDVIVSVNGVSVADYELSYVNNFFNSKPGRKIKVEILRNGEKMKKEFILENQI
jgi:PDZ domain/Aspartyl protease